MQEIKEAIERLELIFAIADNDEPERAKGEHEATFPKIMRLATEALAKLRTAQEQPPAGEFTEDSKYFNKSSMTAFVEREKRLRAMKEWPNTDWYNDEEFCEVYKEACDRLDRSEASRNELLDALEHIRIIPRNFKSGMTYEKRMIFMIEVAEAAIEKANKEGGE